MSEFAQSLDHLVPGRVVVMQPSLTQQVPCFGHEVFFGTRSVCVLEYIARIEPADTFEEPVAELIEK